MSSIQIETSVEIPPLDIPEKPYTFSSSVPFPTADQAQIVCNAISVDEELRPDCVHREISTQGNTVVVKFAAVDVRTLRAAAGTFCDLLALACRAIEAFPPL